MSAKREKGLEKDFRKTTRLRRVAGGTPAVPDNHLNAGLARALLDNGLAVAKI